MDMNPIQLLVTVLGALAGIMFLGFLIAIIIDGRNI